jgi:hypothetical protein
MEAGELIDQLPFFYIRRTPATTPGNTDLI